MITKESILRELGLTEQEWLVLSKSKQDKLILTLRKKWMQEEVEA